MGIDNCKYERVVGEGGQIKLITAVVGSKTKSI